MPLAPILMTLGAVAALALLYLVGGFESFMSFLILFALRAPGYTLIRAIWWKLTKSSPAPGEKRGYVVQYLPVLLAAGITFLHLFVSAVDDDIQIVRSQLDRNPAPSATLVATATPLVDTYLDELWLVLSALQEASDKRNADEYVTLQEALAGTREYREACVRYQTELGDLKPPSDLEEAHLLLTQQASGLLEATDNLLAYLQGEGEGDTALDKASQLSKEADARLQQAVGIIQAYVSD